jgi:16S rRNA processing protein RimM
VTFTSDRDERRAAGAVLYVDDRELVVESVRPHQGRFLVRFAGVTDRDEATRLRGAFLTADPVAGDPDELWVHELIGATVVDRAAGTPHGRIVALEANPAHDLLVLDDGTLVPIVFVVEHSPGRVVVDAPDGLLGG